MLMLMTAIHLISLSLLLLVCILTFITWRRFSYQRASAHNRLWFMWLAVILTGSSTWAASFSLYFEKFGLYPLGLGFGLGFVTYLNYQRSIRNDASV